LLAFNPSEIVRIAADVNGVPERAMRSEAEVRRLLNQQEQDRRQAQQAAIIQPAASAAKDLAQAQAELSVGQQQR
jgi:ABC-type lipoprotein export system ATPase subunit